MMVARLVTEEWEIDKRLSDFGVSRVELIDIVRGVVAARSDASIDDPVTAGGLFAYIFGTRYIRQVFKARGWFQHREDNVESVKHPDRNLKILYQSVDLAADDRHDPQAVSGKGSGADRLIFSGQGRLFDGDELNALNRKISPTLSLEHGFSAYRSTAMMFALNFPYQDQFLEVISKVSLSVYL